MYDLYYTVSHPGYPNLSKSYFDVYNEKAFRVDVTFNPLDCSVPDPPQVIPLACPIPTRINDSNSLSWFSELDNDISITNLDGGTVTIIYNSGACTGLLGAG